MVAAALFDVDGTLVDSTYLHTVAWARTCQAAGEKVAMARLHRLVGMGGEQLTTELFGRARADLIKSQGENFRQLMDDVRPLPGARDLLVAVAARGIQVIVASSSPREQLDRLLQLLDASSAVAATVCASDADRAKPAPDIFAVALERAQVEAHEAIAVGDTGWDVEAATRVGVRTIAVESGGWNRSELERAGAVEVYAGPDDLLSHLDTSQLGQRPRAVSATGPSSYGRWVDERSPGGQPS